MLPKQYNPDAFLDIGYPTGSSFFEKFLSSPEFTVDFLKSFNVSKRSDLKTKEGYAINLVGAILNNELSANELIIKYVQKPRTWLSLMQGAYSETPQLKNPKDLLMSFGEVGWYGPIKDTQNSKVYYIYTQSIAHYIPKEEYIDGKGKRKTYDIAHIRWPIIAEVSDKYVAVSWDGFSHVREDKPNSKNQFYFWLNISEVFKELQILLVGKWEHPELHILLLHKLWDKFLDKPQYEWSHKRVRAESSGIALNAHSSGDTEIEVGDKGLKGLSRKLAEAALDSLKYSFPHDPAKLTLVETAILHTLIREWGTKSYEFSLKKTIDNSSFDADITSLEVEPLKKINIETLFRVHCYFGLDLSSQSQDSLQHLKCYQECGSSDGVLKFLLAELSLE